ncbi:FAS1-like dehydratase domain-containing protein [Euzebya tangerina]|uniref:FAS1-like dehydratase domain-containing protein n=1 Tax=Euzebya tangerina TaxID=591198 RepID=UPI000E30D4D4|nr:MaoC family dehydratase N-terminal domain-containing protein [Euzebya tangerina]
MSLLTDELRARIGEQATYTAPEPLGRAAIRYFAVAIGDTNPVYTDAGAAADAGFADVVAPPTFVVETNAYADRQPDAMGSIGHRWDIEIPGTREIRGGHTYEFGRPAQPEDVLHVTWRLDDAVEKTGRDGRAMLIVTSSQTVATTTGDHLATNVETTIYQALDAPR